MNWQKYAAERDTDVKLAEEKFRAGEQKISELHEQVRSLQRDLIAAGSNTTHGLQQQLTAARHELARDRQFYNQQMKRLQEQHHNLLDQHRASQNELGGVTRQLNEANATIGMLQAQLAGQTPVPGPMPPAPTKTVPGGVSLEDHCAMLTRQLKVTQKENARLQQLNDRPLHGKPGSFDDEDDEEPESDSQQRIKREPQPLSSTVLLPPPNARPENHGQPRPTPVAKTRDRKSPRTTDARRAKRLGAGDPNASREPQASRQAEASSIDLTMSSDDEESAAMPAKQTSRDRLPARMSLHENITVADRSPQPPDSPPTPTPALQAAAKAVNSQAPPKQVFATPGKKRKRSSQDNGASSSAKRGRNKEQEVANELDDLAVNAHGLALTEPTGSRSRRKESYQEQAEDPDDDEESFKDVGEFNFIAVCGYSDDGEVAENYTSEELRGVTKALWERIEELQDVWEIPAGDYWQYDFMKKRSRGKSVCVTQKSRRKATTWRTEGEGKFACSDCVKHNRPCFTYVHGEDGLKGGFRLLPLHEKDRTQPVFKHQETRYWINDAVTVL